MGKSNDTAPVVETPTFTEPAAPPPAPEVIVQPSSAGAGGVQSSAIQDELDAAAAELRKKEAAKKGAKSLQIPVNPVSSGGTGSVGTGQ